MPAEISDDQIPPLGERMPFSKEGLQGWSLHGSNFVQVDRRNVSETRALEALSKAFTVILFAQSEACAVYHVLS